MKAKTFDKKAMTTIARFLNDPQAERTHRQQVQTDFWRVYGVTQSAGSRYEAGAVSGGKNTRPMPLHLKALVALHEGGVITADQLHDALHTARNH